MRKLIKGILEFKKTVTTPYKEAFSKLALGQSPDALFITCSDSRVAPNAYASTNPGDLFVVRNVGNLIPPACDVNVGVAQGCESVAAAIEFAVLNLKVSNIIVCGHSECGAMKSIICNCNNIVSPNLRNWLKHGEKAKAKINIPAHTNTLDKNLFDYDLLSQLNVLDQMNHLLTYPFVAAEIQKGNLEIHGWWFDIAKLDVYYYDTVSKNFQIIDQDTHLVK